MSDIQATYMLSLLNIKRLVDDAVSRAEAAAHRVVTLAVPSVAMTPPIVVELRVPLAAPGAEVTLIPGPGQLGGSESVN